MPKTSPIISPVVSPMSSTIKESASASNDPTISMIIAKAREVTVPAKGSLLMGVSSAILLWVAFTPVDFGAIAWIAFVPLLQLVRIKQPTRWMYRITYFAGLCFFIPTLQWMRLGHVTMYMAWGALAIYLAFYFPLFILLSRVAVHKFRVPLTLTAPVVWVGLEYARAHFMTGFSWYYLGHTQYRWMEMIQVSDLVGAYGVSFVVMTITAMLAGLVPLSWLKRFRLIPSDSQIQNDKLNVVAGNSDQQLIPIIASLSLFAMVLGYGYYRTANVIFEQGPRVGLIQGNFPAEVKHDPSKAQNIFSMYRGLTGQAAKSAHLDLVVWPESMYRAPLLEAPSKFSENDLQTVAPQVPVEAWKDLRVRQTLTQLSTEVGSPMIIGLDTVVAEYPQMQQYNSALFIKQSRGIDYRYDKIHRVPFGEYIPLEKQLPFLQRFTPYGSGFGIAKGEGSVVFSDRGFSYTPVICFEDTVPHLVREIVKSTHDENGKSVDCLVNISNDGWFHGSSELDQHLITSAFRAVECRTPMIRAANGGISATIDGNGHIREPEIFKAIAAYNPGRSEYQSLYQKGNKRWNKSLNAVIVDTVPLDNRGSFYVATGDWFASTCGIGCLCCFAGLFFRRKRQETEKVN